MILGAPQAAPAAADSLRRALTEVFAQPQYHWALRRPPLAWLFELLSRFLDWGARFDTAHPGLSTVVAWSLGIVLAGILAHLTWIGIRGYRATTAPARRPTAGGIAPLLDDAPAHLARAEALARSGRYAEAVAHRFVAVVLQLERARALAFHPSKTPAEYVAEARIDGDARASFAGLVASLYGYVFGAAPCDDAGYRAFGTVADGVLARVPVR